MSIEVIHIDYYNTDNGTVETLRFTSSPDFRANGVNYLPVIKERFSFSEHLFQRGTSSGEATIGVGEIVVSNINGALDKYRRYGFDGRKIQIYRPTDKSERYTTTANLYFTGTMDNPNFGWSEATFTIKSRMEILNVPMQVSTLLGTNLGTGGAGGYEGSADLAGKIKPQVFGRCMSCEGALINAFYLMYAFNFNRDGTAAPVYQFYNVFVKGVRYIFDADYSSLTALQAASIAAGKYATCLASGTLRLGSVPASNGKVVADIADAPDASCSAGRVLDRILSQNAVLAAGTDYATDGIDTFNSCPVGIYITDGMSIGAAVNAIADSVGAWFCPDASGLFDFGLIETPTKLKTLGFASIGTLTSKSWATSIERQAVGDDSKNIPAYSVRLAHTKNWATQDNGSLADSVGALAREFFTKEFRFTESHDASVLDAHPLAPTLEFETLLLGQLPFALLNADFSVPIGASDWVLSGLGGVASQTASGILTVTPSGNIAQVNQNLVLNSAIFPGATEFGFTLISGFGVRVQILRGTGPTIIYDETIAAVSSDTNISRSIVLPVDTGTSFSPYAMRFLTTSTTLAFKIRDAYWRSAQQGLSPLNEAARRRVRESGFQERYTLTIALETYTKLGGAPGKLITLKDNRFEMAAGKDFLIIGAEQDGDTISVELDVLG